MENEIRHMDPMELLPKYFAGELNAEERSLVEVWRNDNDENRKEFQALEKLWNFTGDEVLKAEIDLNIEWKMLESSIMPARTKTLYLRRVLQLAASVLILLSVSYFGYKTITTTSEKSMAAESRTINLPDGSTISLNAHSKISYAKGFGTTHRNISLKGEAYFEVKKNAELPFIISANGASIQVVGTKFNVKAYKGQVSVKVMVKEGTVKLFETSKPAKEAVLNAGETGVYDKNLKVVKKQVTLNENDIAWKTQVMKFENTPLSEVAEIISNTYHISIIVEPSIKDCPITVDFEQKDLKSVLSVLKSTHELSITSEGKQIKLSGKGC